MNCSEIYLPVVLWYFIGFFLVMAILLNLEIKENDYMSIFAQQAKIDTIDY